MTKTFVSLRTALICFALSFIFGFAVDHPSLLDASNNLNRLKMEGFTSFSSPDSVPVVDRKKMRKLGFVETEPGIWEQKSKKTKI